jgi:hypothetical protein
MSKESKYFYAFGSNKENENGDLVNCLEISPLEGTGDTQAVWRLEKKHLIDLKKVIDNQLGEE